MSAVSKKPKTGPEDCQELCCGEANAPKILGNGLGDEYRNGVTWRKRDKYICCDNAVTIYDPTYAGPSSGFVKLPLTTYKISRPCGIFSLFSFVLAFSLAAGITVWLTAPAINKDISYGNADVVTTNRFAALVSAIAGLALACACAVFVRCCGLSEQKKALWITAQALNAEIARKTKGTPSLERSSSQVLHQVFVTTQVTVQPPAQQPSASQPPAAAASIEGGAAPSDGRRSPLPPSYEESKSELKSGSTSAFAPQP